MKLVVRVRLLPTPEQASALGATLRACNAAASDVAELARDVRCYRNYDLRRLAYDSDGTRYAGAALNGYRRRQQRLRQRLQAKNTSSARRLLARRRKREARHAANTNHIISKRIVTEAERTGRGIAVEELTGIRERVRLRRPQRVTLHSWSFQRLGAFLAYKARRAG